MKVADQEEHRRLEIQRRVAALLCEHRARAGRSIRAVARKIKVKRSKLRSWEAGRSTPPGHVFVALVSLYGAGAVQAAIDLDFQFQMENLRARQSHEYTEETWALAA